jgi:hypothetical protein
MALSALLLAICSEVKRRVSAASPRLLGALVLALLGGNACHPNEERAGPTSPPETARSPVGEALGFDAAALEPSVDPLAAAGDLRAEMDAFTTVDACVAQRAAMDPLVGDALEAIGYDTLLRDACRLLGAAKARDARRCADIVASALEARCRARVAELAGDPDACPFDVPSHPELGRDAGCLALATRDGRLCAGAFDRTARATCQAITGHDPAPCTQLPLRVDQERCARDANRWADALPPSDAGSVTNATLPSTGTFRPKTSPADGGESAFDVSRGAVLVERSDGMHLIVGTMSDAGLGFVAPSPNTLPTLALEVLVPRDPKTAAGCGNGAHRPPCGAGLLRAQLAEPGHPPTSLTDARAKDVTLVVNALEPTRGGRAELVLFGAFGDTGDLAVTVTTFVRDVVTSRALFDASRRGEGEPPRR